MNPIVGNRYRCKHCWEENVVTEQGVGFDLCEDCYHTLFKRRDLANLYHTQGHVFELITIHVASPISLHPDDTSGDAEDYGLVAASSQSDGEESSQSDINVTHKRRRLYYQSDGVETREFQSDVNVNHKRRKLYYQSDLNVYNGIICYNPEEVQSIEDEAANGSFSLISVFCRWILCSCFSAPSI